MISFDELPGIADAPLAGRPSARRPAVSAAAYTVAVPRAVERR
ncbi:protein of unknown function [Burkholderia multivorans]